MSKKRTITHEMSEDQVTQAIKEYLTKFYNPALLTNISISPFIKGTKRLTVQINPE